MHPDARTSDVCLIRGRLALGDFELTRCSGGTYLLDGGAMFGAVPKTLWSNRTMPVESNL